MIDLITEMTRLHGHAPTIREIAKAMGIKSPDTVKFHLDKLREAGRVTWLDGASRTLRVLTQPQVA